MTILNNPLTNNNSKTKSNNKTKTKNKIKVVYTEDLTHPIREDVSLLPVIRRPLRFDLCRTRLPDDVVSSLSG